MAKTKAKRPAAKKAAVKKTQPARKQPARRVSTGSHSSASAASSIAKSPAVTTRPKRSTATVSGASAHAKSGRTRTSSSPSRTRVESMVVGTVPSTVNASATLQLDEWYWILAAAIPTGLPGRQRLLETFASIYDCPASERKIPKKDSPWTDPFYDFVWVACELFIHYEPFGGPGSSRPVTFHAAELSRNKVIARIMKFAYGEWNKEPKPWDEKSVSSHMQVCVKKLLATYNNAALPQEVRHNAGVALKHLSQDYPLKKFYHSFVVQPGSTPTPDKYRQRVNELLRDTTIQTDDYTPVLKEKGQLALHPLIAWLLNSNCWHLDQANLETTFHCEKNLTPHQLSKDVTLVGRVWWDEFVVKDTQATLDFVRDWFLTRGRNGNSQSDFAKAAAERRRPILADIVEKHKDL